VNETTLLTRCGCSCSVHSCLSKNLALSLLVRPSDVARHRSAHRTSRRAHHQALSYLAHTPNGQRDRYTARLTSRTHCAKEYVLHLARDPHYSSSDVAQIYETLSPLNGQVNHNTLSFIRRANVALDQWWQDCDDLHRRTMDEEHLLRKMLAGELHYAKLWLVCVALRGVSWDKMPFEQRELAFQAKDAASACLAVFLHSPAYRAAIRYAVHDVLVTAAFSGLFLLKMANLFPGELDLAVIVDQVEQLAQVLSDVSAERYALTLRVMLASLRRKLGLAVSGGPPMAPATGMPLPLDGLFGDLSTADGQPASMPFTMEELGFPAWPAERGALAFGPSNIPAWLGEQGLTDLGIPMNGSDGIFLQMAGAGRGWGPDGTSMPEAW
jgi:hypothetical protein